MTGTVGRAAEVSPVPIINAGDGSGEHPTQALLDLYTLRSELCQIDNLHVAMVGDLRYGRTVHSLSRALSLFDNVTQTFISPDTLRMPDDVLKDLDESKVKYNCLSDYDDILPEIDVLYVTRIQKERIDDPAEYERLANIYQITPDTLSKMSTQARILHPLPRVNEITPEVDKDPRAAYFRQAHNGLFVRRAILNWILSN